LIGFLGPSAFEEGIVERYPIFFSIVLNHVSDDSTKDFAHAVDILKLLFEILGCKVWLKTTFSPSVMRNTLLRQCFHTRIEGIVDFIKTLHFGENIPPSSMLLCKFEGIVRLLRDLGMSIYLTVY